MAANKIIEKIKADANAEADIILSQAQDKAKAVADKIQEAAEIKAGEIRIQASKDADEAGRRQMLIAELGCRKNTLDSQRAVIEEAFAKAEDELTKLPEGKWQELITKIIVRATETGNEELIVPAEDVPKYENGFLSKLNNIIQSSGKEGNLTLSKDKANFKGGVIIKGKISDFDGSFGTLLRDIRVRIEKEVAAMLFAEVK